MPAATDREARIGIVLSGGGARGAYEAGVITGIAEALGAGPAAGPTFDVISGTSVGAINGAWLAANAHRADHDALGLAGLWRALQLAQHVRLDPRALLSRRRDPERFGRSLFDPRPFERLVTESVDWGRLHHNLEHRVLRAFIVSALHVGTGATTLFTELAPAVAFNATDHPRRVSRAARIGPEHVLASAAIPLLFPARRIGGAFFADGGLRFNTPISPALRAGAEKLVVVTLRHEPSEARLDVPGLAEEQYPSFVFLAGKLLNALLLDPVADDLETLQHLNAFVDGVQAALTARERERVDAALLARGGRTYRKVETLHFAPSRNIGALASEHLREHPEGGPLAASFWAGRRRQSWEADLASYLLFDSKWTSRLVELGHADALAKRDAVRAFFAA